MSRPFVLDASAAIAWASPDEHPPEPLGAAIESGAAVVPALWLYEVHHVLHMMRRRARISEGDYSDSAAALIALRLEVEPADRSIVETAVPELAKEHGLTAYDAAYLELAHRRRLPLATLDNDLKRAAKKARIKLI